MNSKVKVYALDDVELDRIIEAFTIEEREIINRWNLAIEEVFKRRLEK